jgi:TfoX/Sxy family transcriptional regulator of competence genes
VERSLLSLILPEGLLDHFIVKEIKELGEVSTRKMFYEIHLEENNELLNRDDASQYESKGFTEVTIQDFPLRGKAVYLVIRRRRWRHKQNPKDIVRNDYSFVAEGSKLTKELGDFLKGTGRYKGGYD